MCSRDLETHFPMRILLFHLSLGLLRQLAWASQPWSTSDSSTHIVSSLVGLSYSSFRWANRLCVACCIHNFCVVYTQLMLSVDCMCQGMAPSHTFLLPGRVDFQSVDTTGLAVSNNSPAFSMAEAGCIRACLIPLMSESSLCLTDRLTYGKTLETNTFQFSSPDYVYMLLFGMGCMSVRTSLRPFISFLLMYCLGSYLLCTP